MENKSKELEVAIEAALEAGKILEKFFEQEVAHSSKEDKSIVTALDGEAEEVIKKIISKEFPAHSFLGEETGHTDNKGEYTWYIDPLDGTRNFVRHLPLFAVSIALEQKGEIILSVIYNPAARSLFYAEKGKGAYMNDAKISVSKNNPTHSSMCAGKGSKPEDRKLCRQLIFSLPEAIPGLTFRDIGCTALDLAYVACGGFDAGIHIGLNGYDFAAGTLLVQEAGGKITNFDGSLWKFPDQYFYTSNGVLDQEILEEVRKQKEKLGIL
jgi:myo-inositol-1(or 4)-monophosphatase